MSLGSRIRLPLRTDIITRPFVGLCRGQQEVA